MSKSKSPRSSTSSDSSWTTIPDIDTQDQQKSAKKTETTNLDSLKPKIDSNKRGLKFSKKIYKKLLNEWKLNRVKGQEDWKKEEWIKAQGKKPEKKILGSKYVKYKVIARSI